MRNHRLGDTIWTQAGKNSGFSGADGGLELQPHICLCLANVHTSCGLCLRADTACPHTSSKEQRWAVGGSGWRHCPAPLPGYWHIQSPQQHKNLRRISGTNYSEASFLAHRMWTCLFFSSVPPRLNSGMVPRCEHWDDGLKLTELCI